MRTRSSGVPIITEQEVLYYRKDLLTKAGFDSPPKTLDELKAQRREDRGRTTRASPASWPAPASPPRSPSSPASSTASAATSSTRAARPLSTATQAKQAYAYYGGLIKDHGPENVSTDMSWSEAMAIFTQGKAAFYTEANSLYKNATDPAKSKVADTVGFAPFPAGPAGSKPYNVPSWALGVNDASENQDNAWKFIEWATGKEQTLAKQKAGVPGARTSVWANPEGTADLPEGPRGGHRGQHRRTASATTVRWS